MKFQRLFASILVACGVVSAFADAGNTLITFSTKGPDLYADGTTVHDGEWYALCWSPTATFGGISSTCEAVVPGEKVYLVAPLAKGGRCPTVVFQLDSKTAPTNGNYSISMLDTRDASGSVASANASGLPVRVNALVSTQTIATGSAGPIAVSSKGTDLASATWAESNVEDIAAPVIKSFRVSGDKAFIRVSNLSPSVKYNVFAGETPDAISSTTLELPVSAEKNDVEFVLDAQKGKFFRVGRQPLN